MSENKWSWSMDSEDSGGRQSEGGKSGEGGIWESMGASREKPVQQEQPAQQAAAGPVKAAASAGNAGYAPQYIARLHTAINDSKMRAFGGTIFRFEDEDGLPRVGFAVTNLTYDQANAMKSRYARLCESDMRCFLGFAGMIPVKEYWVYAFRVPAGASSIYREVRSARETGAAAIDGEQLLRQLVQIFLRRESRSGEGGYQPLLCVSPYTVYVIRDAERDAGVQLLPLISVDGSRPVEIPADPKPDVSTDVYSACYLYCEVLSGGFACDGFSQIVRPDPCIINAMAPVVNWRPDIRVFANQLNLDAPQPQAKAPVRAAAQEQEAPAAEVRQKLAGIGGGLGEALGKRLGNVVQKLRESKDNLVQDRVDAQQGTIKSDFDGGNG